MFQILKEIINRQQNIMDYYVISTKMSMYWPISSAQGVSSVCTTATVMTIFVDNGDKEN